MTCISALQLFHVPSLLRSKFLNVFLNAIFVAGLWMWVAFIAIVKEMPLTIIMYRVHKLGRMVVAMSSVSQPRCIIKIKLEDTFRGRLSQQKIADQK